MEFALSGEQRLLQDSVRRFLESECPLDRVRVAADAAETRADNIYRGLADLGVFGILIREEHGGVGLGFLEAALVAEALGGAVVPIPYIGAIMASVALMNAGSDAQRDTWLPKIAAADTVFGVGVTEKIGRRDSTGITATAGKLNGTAMFVVDGVDADMFIIADSTGTLHLVNAHTEGVEVKKLKSIDRTRSLAEVGLNGAIAEPLAGPRGTDALQRTIDAGRLMLAADCLGAAQTMVDKSVAYAKERKQFNRVIGSFQAVKHMCAEMAAELEPCRSLVWYAAHATLAIPDEARLMTCHAKAHLAEIGQFVARTATEVHGGMGFTDLLGLHYWFKRIGFDRQILGSPETLRQEAAAIQGWV